MNPQIENKLAVKIHKTAYALGKMAGKIVSEEVGLSFPQFMILTGVKYHPHCSQKDIADFRQLTEAAVSKQVDSLVEAGFLARKVNPDNRRAHDLELTPQGAKIQDKAEQRVLLRYEEVFDRLHTDQQQQLHTTLDKLLEYLTGAPKDFYA